MTIFPNAKINIGLNIVNKRSDGFHEIETVFYPVKLSDKLEFLPNDKDNDVLEISGIEIPSDGTKNLVLRALDILRKDFKIPFLDIKLTKQIPFGAGLGGGSADAAFFLKALNKEFKLGISNDDLKQKAAILGSDCAFFIDNAPRFATGRGEIFTHTDCLDEKYNIVIIKPKFEISTAFAYSKVKPQTPKTSLKEDFKKPLSEWKRLIKNDFEEFLFPFYPKLKTMKQELYNSGAIYASMTGSGSALFGIFDFEPALHGEIKALRVL
ncbi:MAG: 4-(cytidine 5'-diphospho)-2-C-methyl-D-erythritol kinase [Bacteroidales bacterium]|nr:4-(cytidine 5'-diphospho)-2-C-methyl-D-erythritol kinase [Bacteroidales bacterium]